MALEFRKDDERKGACKGNSRQGGLREATDRSKGAVSHTCPSLGPRGFLNPEDPS